MPEKFSVKIKSQAHIYIHNTIDNTAWYLKEKIEERIKKGERDGISLEIMSCLVMIAFAFEAKINLLGFKLFDKWEERQGYLYKFERVANRLGVKIDYDTQPHSTVKDIKSFRDTIAHGKPHEIKEEKEQVLTEEELEKRNILKAEWESCLTEDFLRRAYDDLEKIWKDLFGKSGLNILDTVTSGESAIQILERVE